MRTDTGQVELEIGTADVNLENLVLGNIEARVETGDVILSRRFSGGGRIFVRTRNITSRVLRDGAADLILETRVGEVVREEAPQSEGG